MPASKASQEFNRTYGLTDLNLKWFEQATSDEKEAKAKHAIAGKTQNVWTDVIKRFFKNKWNIVFTLIFVGLIALVIIAPLASKYSSDKPVSDAVQSTIALNKPSWASHWDQATKLMTRYDLLNASIDFKKTIISVNQIPGSADYSVIYVNPSAQETFLGTDTAGRDVWTRLWTGAGWSLKLAFFVAVVQTTIGIFIGIYLGFHIGKFADTFLMRVIEIFQSVPSLLWMFLFAMILGSGFWSIAVVLILVGWIGPVYTSRMFTIKIKDSEFIKAAESIGVSKAGRLYRHILPAIIGRLLVSFVHAIPAIIFFETVLVFLHMNVGAGQATIGNIISDARSLDAISKNITYPISVSCFLLVLSVSMQIIANGLRDAFDPKVSS